MIKIYEAIRKNTARLVTNYLGVSVTLNFENGNIYSGVNAFLKTNDKFIQDAIEHDSRFGVTIRLKQRIVEDSDMAPEEDEAQQKSAENGGTVKKGKKSKAVADASIDENAEVVEAVKTVNDAVDFFAEKGILVDDASQIEELCAKHNVKFPNLK